MGGHASEQAGSEQGTGGGLRTPGHTNAFPTSATLFHTIFTLGLVLDSFEKGVPLLVESLKSDGPEDPSSGLSGAFQNPPRLCTLFPISRKLPVAWSPSPAGSSFSVRCFPHHPLPRQSRKLVLHTSATLLLTLPATQATVALNAAPNPSILGPRGQCLLFINKLHYVRTLFSAEDKFF